MYAYGANNPVMNVDPSGYAPGWLEDYWEWVKDGYEAIYEELQREFVLDISWSFSVFKVGISVIVNYEDEYMEFYPHGGLSIGLSQGASMSFGVVDNNEKTGDYQGLFEYIEATYYVGGGYCFSPLDPIDGAKAYYLEFGSPNISVGIDYYLWFDWLVIDWSDR